MSDVDPDDVKKAFERRKWEFLRDLDKAYKALEEERAKPDGERLQPDSLFDKWDAYLANVKSVCEKAVFPSDLPPKIERISKLEKETDESWPVSNTLSDYLFAVEEAWGIFG